MNFNLHGQRIHSLKDRLRPDTDHRDHYESLIFTLSSAAHKLEAERDRLNSDHRFSELGRTEEVQKLVGISRTIDEDATNAGIQAGHRNALGHSIKEYRTELLPTGLLKDVIAVARAARKTQQQLASRRETLVAKPKVLEPTDAVAELRRQERRRLIREAPSGERGRIASQLASTEDGLDAILSASLMETGLTGEVHASLQEQRSQKHFGPALAKLVQDERDAGTINDAATMALSMLQRASGMPEHDFAKLVNPLIESNE